MSEAEGGERRARASSLALLEWLRPPAGYVTDCALGTSFSLDLITCVAALVSLDGAARDTADFSLTAALRAMNRLSDNVRVVVQQGCIHWRPGTHPGVLPLLDRVVRPVSLPLTGGSFHPKVWVVRQRAAGEEAGGVRYVLVVGSRNLTRDASWDLGVALEGYVGEAAGLDGHDELVDFVRFACEAGGTRSFAERFRDLGSVSWDLPPGVSETRFGFHGRTRMDWSQTALLSLPENPRRVLVLSPFLDADSVKQVAARWGDAPERRLVSGTEVLDRIADTQQKAALEKLDPRFMEIARDEPVMFRGEHAAEAAETAAREDPEVAEEPRGLHAKVVAVWHRRRAHVLIGSANLTRPGWLGANAEAWVLLSGNPTLADALWDWSAERSSEYHARDEPAAEPDAEIKALDDAHRYVAARRYTLHEHGTEEARLEADAPPLPRTLGQLNLRVARLSQPKVASPWAPEARATAMPACDPAERTAFLIFTLRARAGLEALERTWVQHVTLEPKLDDQRDGALLRRVLGPQQFLEYLRGYLDPAAGDSLDETPGEAHVGPSCHGDGSPSYPTEELRIETILRALARNPKETVATLGKAIEQYRAAAAADGDPRLSELWEVWQAIEGAYGR
ncbi:phospholipase D family protein [Sorangium sp. So ce513]|uniref:phospholipase D family protein n=1 Tax=Sorangium sp. So ce513 TaxID=3133315 RepID=UPI003F5FAF0E